MIDLITGSHSRSWIHVTVSKHPLIGYLSGSFHRPGCGSDYIFSAVLVTRYLCAYCGFNEEWVDDRADLEKLMAKYCG